MNKKTIFAVIFVFFTPLASMASEKGVDIPNVKIEMTEEAIKRGEEVFKEKCNNCHGIKYLGFESLMPAKAVARAFGAEPVDLSLIAKARGRGDKGAQYIYALLTSYINTPEKNSIFPNISMPPPLSKADQGFEQMAKDVSAFLLYAAEPTASKRKRLGKYVVGYMMILTFLLFMINRKTWKDKQRSG